MEGDSGAVTHGSALLGPVYVWAFEGGEAAAEFARGRPGDVDGGADGRTTPLNTLPMPLRATEATQGDTGDEPLLGSQPPAQCSASWQELLRSDEVVRAAAVPPIARLRAQWKALAHFLAGLPTLAAYAAAHPAEVEDAAKRATVLWLPAAEGPLFDAGDAADCMYVVLSGGVALHEPRGPPFAQLRRCGVIDRQPGRARRVAAQTALPGTAVLVLDEASHAHLDRAYHSPRYLEIDRFLKLRVPVVSERGVAELARLHERVAEMQPPPGRTLLRAGARPRAVLVVRAGCAVAEWPAGGSTRLLPGSVVCADEMLAAAPLAYSVRAGPDGCAVLGLTLDALLGHLSPHSRGDMTETACVLAASRANPLCRAASALWVTEEGARNGKRAAAEAAVACRGFASPRGERRPMLQTAKGNQASRPARSRRARRPTPGNELVARGAGRPAAPRLSELVPELLFPERRRQESCLVASPAQVRRGGEELGPGGDGAEKVPRRTEPPAQQTALVLDGKVVLPTRAGKRVVQSLGSTMGAPSAVVKRF